MLTALKSSVSSIAVAYSYIRFSHPDQRRGNSLRRQMKRSQAYCTAKLLQLDDTIQDLARSAFHNRHTVTGNLGAFLKLVRSGDIRPGSYLLIESWDRLSRDEFWPAFNLIREIFEARINITTLPDEDEVHEYSYDAINKNPALVHEIINDLTRGHGEVKMKSARCRDACESQRQDARAGIAKIPGRCWPWLKPIRGVIEVVDELGEKREKRATIGFEEIASRVAIVRMIFEWALTVGLGTIVDRLNSNPEWRVAFGRDGWHKRTVLNTILRNTAVIGWKTTGWMERDPEKRTAAVAAGMKVEGECIKDTLNPIKDHYPVIIDPDLFWRVQGAINDRKTNGGAGRIGKSIPNLLRGILTCRDCGKPLHYIGIGDDYPSQRYLICSRGKRSLCGNKVHYIYGCLEDELLTILPLIDLSRLTQHSNAEAAKGAALEAQLAEKSANVTELAKAKISPEIIAVINQLTDELATLRTDYAAWQEQHRIIEAQASQDRHTQFVALVEQMRDADDDRRLMIRSGIAAEFRRLMESAVADDNSITIMFRPAPHQQLELKLVNNFMREGRTFVGVVERLTMRSRCWSDPDYPSNPMRRLVSFRRDQLLDPEFVSTEGFRRYVN